MPPPKCVDILFLAKNRKAMTSVALDTLLRNTDWQLVRSLTLWDDGSADGTYRELSRVHEIGSKAVRGLNCMVITHRSYIGTPIIIAEDFEGLYCQAPYFAKIDNDAMMPPDWLGIAMAVMEANPEVEVLGLEDPVLEPTIELDRTPGLPLYQPSRWVGGLFVAHRGVFDCRPAALPTGGDGVRFGWQDWLDTNTVRCGWIEPPLPVFLLDRLPFEPWLSLSAEYERKGWQRPWRKYDPVKHAYLWQWAGDLIQQSKEVKP